jgi:hypothetical protein
MLKMLDIVLFPFPPPRYKAANEAKDRLQVELGSAQFKVNQAQKVLTAVKQEVERWQQSGAAMDIKHQQVLGEVLLSAGYMSYLGPLPGSYRKQVWIKCVESNMGSSHKLLASPVKMSTFTYGRGWLSHPALPLLALFSAASG